jgi:hypothetical protein
LATGVRRRPTDDRLVSNNFIFLKSQKTAGTSVETVLSTWCAGRDIVTPITKENETERAKLGGRAMNYQSGPFFNHQPASEVRRLLPDLWQSAFKFTIERHPYERVVSRVYWRIYFRGGDRAADFDRQLENVLSDPSSIDNRPIYCIDDTIAVDEVILFDDLWRRLGEIAVTMGRSLPDALPRAKGRSRIDRRPAREILTDAHKERIYHLLERDFVDLGFAA